MRRLLLGGQPDYVRVELTTTNGSRPRILGTNSTLSASEGPALRLHGRVATGIACDARSQLTQLPQPHENHGAHMARPAPVCIPLEPAASPCIPTANCRKTACRAGLRKVRGAFPSISAAQWRSRQSPTSLAPASLARHHQYPERERGACLVQARPGRGREIDLAQTHPAIKW